MWLFISPWAVATLDVFLFLTEENTKEALPVKKSLSEKVSLYRGDITLLEIDAIVNAGRCKRLLMALNFLIIHCPAKH